MEMESSLNSINEMFGGYENKMVFTIYGQSHIGKTLLLLQEAYWFLKNGYTVWWIDTEGGGDALINEWRDVFQKRFGTKKDVKYKLLRNLDDLFEWYGWEIKFDVSKKGKQQVFLGKKVVKSKTETILNYVRKNSKIVIIMDSITSPIKMNIPANQKNYPVRADVIALLFGVVFKVLDSVGEGFAIFTAHESLDPTNPRVRRGEALGGANIQYFSKQIMYMEAPNSYKLRNFRHIYAVRSSKCERWGMDRWIKIVEDGFVDSSEEEMLTVYKEDDKNEEEND